MPAPGFINGVDAKVHGAVAVIFAGIAQLVERRLRTAQVPGSTPGSSSKPYWSCLRLCGSAHYFTAISVKDQPGAHGVLRT